MGVESHRHPSCIHFSGKIKHNNKVTFESLGQKLVRTAAAATDGVSVVYNNGQHSTAAKPNDLHKVGSFLISQ
jgi:hypothetical protein